jgi:hypothetical protein
MAPKPRDVWGIPIPNAKDVVSYINSAMNTLSIASGDKPALTPGANAVRRSGEAVSYVNSAINPFAETSKKLIGQAAGKPGANKALAKSVGVDAAVALTAALGGKAVSQGVGAAQKAAQTNPNVKAAIAKATSIPESISYAAKTNPRFKAANAKYSDLPGYISNELRRNFEIEVNVRNHPYFIDSGGYGASAGVAGSRREPGVANNLRQLIADQKLRKKIRPYEEVLINDDMVLIQAAKVINKATEKEFKGITKRIK